MLLLAARELIESETYLPTLSRMLSACDDRLAMLGLPHPRDAYREACNAPSPKEAQRWSHAAVYHAGRALGWHRLRTATERDTWPEFQRVYRDCCRRALAGELPALPDPPRQPESAAADREQGRRRLRQLREELKT